MTLPHDPDLADRMANMEPSLLRLLTLEFTSFGLWDAMRYFLETDTERATLDDIGFSIGRDSSAMLAILGDLTTKGWLSRRTLESGVTEYGLTQERERRSLLNYLYAAFQDSTFRLQAIYHWTQLAT